MAKIVLKNVNKIFNDKAVGVKDINLAVNDKEFFVLVGPSGCGKSTTLRLIAGLEKPSSGEIYVGGKLINDIPPGKRDVTMVFQDYALYPHMTVYENLAFPLKLRKYKRKEINDKVQKAAKILGLEGLLERKPKALSGGQRQRVALGRSIVRNPKVFLFDEPLSNLDAKLRIEMRAELKQLHQRLKATTIYVTHDQTEAMTMGDKICILNNGKIQQINDPLSLYNYPVNKFVASFIGTPSMNFFEGKLESNGTFGCEDFSIKIAGSAPEVEVILGIRPEDIYPVKQDTDIRGRITLVEPIGNEIFLHLDVGKTHVVLRTSPTSDFKTGQAINLTFEKKKFHLFNKSEGLRIDL